MLNRRSVLAAFAASPVVTVLAQSGADRIFTVSDGQFSLPAGALSRGRDSAEIRTALTAAGLNADEQVSYLNITVLERGGEYVLFDCGAGQNFVPGTGQLQKSLAAAGVDPEKVKHLCFTHAHPDHLWGALDDFGAPAFPNATYYLAKGEHDFWHHPDTLAQLPDDRKMFASGAQRHIKELAAVLQPFSAGQEILSGIFAFPAFGHTPGHIAYDVKVGGDIVSVIGDALTHPVISFAYPDWAGGFDHQPDIAAQTRKVLLDRLAAEKRQFIAYHLPNGGRGRVDRNGNGYRFAAA